MKKKFICLYFLFLVQFVTAEVHTNHKQSKLSNDPRDLYVDLMIKCLINSIYEDHSIQPGLPNEYNSKLREVGKDWPSIGHSMIGQKRMENIHYCVKDVLKNKIPGDLIETGVWRGGATILMRSILKVYGDKKRKVWVADSFEGLPPPNSEKYPADKNLDLNKYKELAVSLDQVKSNFAKYGLLDNQVVFLKGLFSETLPTAPIKSISVLRLDGDLYESTMDALVNLYPKLSIGGYVIIDDYGVISACAKAVEDYRRDLNIDDQIIWIDLDGVYWKKTK